MMGHKERLKGELEYDAFTSWRKFLGWKSGTLKYAKRKFNKRQRKQAKRAIRSEVADR